MESKEDMDVDSNDSISSDDEKDEEDNELEIRAKELEEQLSNNKYLYDVHTELVEIYSKTGDLKSLREAYERFSLMYPLTPELWLKWINIEINLASDKDKENIIALFEKAIKDYQSVDLWLEYVQFAIGACTTEQSRTIFEKGLSNVGLHVGKGHLLWDNLREFELIHLSLLEENTEEWQLQLNKIVEIFKRQLSVPLLYMESTYEEFQEFKKKYPQISEDEKSIEFVYKKALKLLEAYKVYEEQLLIESNEDKRVDIYKEYLQNVKDPSLTINLYERIVLEFALNGDIWNDYCNFALKLNLGISVNDKALRNCPWNENLWVTRLRILEYENKSQEEVLKAFEDGLQAIQPNVGLDLWLTYFEYTQRNATTNKEDLIKLKNLYEQVKDLLNEHDATCKVLRFIAAIFARNNEMDLTRKIWGNVTYKLGKTYQIYLEYINLEKQFGDAKSVRMLYQKAINSCKDYPEYLIDEWLMYERQIGTLNDVMDCIEKCKKFKLKKRDDKHEENDKRGNFKRRHDVEGSEASTRKMMKLDIKSNVDAHHLEQQQQQQQQYKPRPNFDPNLTVFVSNLPYSVEEDRLKEFFPNALSIYKPTADRKGKSRCYAYCTFGTPEEVATALARDRERIDDRPVFISECKPDRNQRQNTFKYSTSIEKNKLFVKGLPFISNQQAVENIFKPHGATNVRLVTKKNGQSKGCAYVDFADEKSAAKCLKETDGLQIGEHKIVVAISQPPPPRSDDFKEPTRHARSKLSSELLIPRGVQLRQSKKDDDSESKNNSGDTNNSKNGQDAKGPPVTQKSNADFRKMFLS